MSPTIRRFASADRAAVFARNPGQWALLQKMKSVFDPDDILHRGKWGMASRQEHVA